MGNIQITSPGIRKALRKYSYVQAISEYIWNGFDAKASNVKIIVDSNDVGTISKVSIIDDGYGIDFEKLKLKFEPFFESEKEITPDSPRTTSTIHGKNGVGRLTFFSFASRAVWDTIYSKNGKNYKYRIEVLYGGLNKFSNTEIEETIEQPGTTVSFFGIQNIVSESFNNEINDYLQREFCWFLELNASKNFSLSINDKKLDHSSIISDVDSYKYTNSNIDFHIRFIQWKENINKEFSRYYLLDSENNEKVKFTTTLNYKSDHFYHSVFITSSFFNNYFPNLDQNEDNEEFQPTLTNENENKIYKELMKNVEQFLLEKRKPFLKLYTDVLINEYKSEGVFPKFNKNEWEIYRNDELEQVIRELYQVEPKIFTKLNIEQKKTFVHLLNLIIDTGESESLLDILDSVIGLSSKERNDLSKLLKTASLSNIIKTIKLIEDRFLAIAELKELVFNNSIGASESSIQNFIENHYWIFGEQYHLVTAAEPKFEEALRRFIYLLRGEKQEVLIDHPDKKKEMDIFIVRQDVDNDIINNIVVELKHPNIKLGSKQLEQVKKYMGVIMKQDLFNAQNMTWHFFLVGNSFDNSGYIETELKNSKHHGEKSIVLSVDNYKIYVKKWSEIFADFELRHKFLYSKLELERKNLLANDIDIKQISELSILNSARQAPEIIIPR